MFSFVIINNQSQEWWAARDRFGIKPLYVAQHKYGHILSSEPISIRELIPTTLSEESILEWKYIRSPLPGHTFFNEIHEVLPGSIIYNGSQIDQIKINPQTNFSIKEFDPLELENDLVDAIKSHQLADCDLASFLSGGLDSSIIALFSSVKHCYSVGTSQNNEFEASALTANQLNKDIHSLEVDESDLLQTWNHLICLKGEPLSVPNEALIYLLSKSLPENQKVFLTGEGADELFSGYYRIYRESLFNPRFDLHRFFSMYFYSDKPLEPERRLYQYLMRFWENSPTPYHAVKEVFLSLHLPILLRRMDFASMAASKEARVPFVSNKLFSKYFWLPPDLLLNNTNSKLPLRQILAKYNLTHPLSRDKVGFVASTKNVLTTDRFSLYINFREFCLQQLKW